MPPRAHAGPSSAVPKRKRASAAGADAASDAPVDSVAATVAGAAADAQLELSSDDEAGVSGDDEADDDDEEADAFPEIDDASSAAGSEGPESAESDESERYDSEDIDNWDEDEEDALADELAADSETETSVAQKLDYLVARHTVKPDESAPTYNKLGLSTLEAAPAHFDARTRHADGAARGIFQVSEVTGKAKRVYPAIEADYDSDSSTEDAPNRVGNVPMEWYDDLPHIGYDVEGRKVMRPATKDELDKFLATVEDPDAWMSAQDRLTGQDVKLTDEELDIIRRLQNAEIPDGAYDPYAPWDDWYTGKGKELVMPLSNRPEPKSRFVPSKWEHKKVMKIVRAIRQGRITPRAPAAARPEFYNIWNDSDQPRAPHAMHMPAPKEALPGHGESYNPPAEYLFSTDERAAWEEAEASERKTNYMPAKHGALRLVPAYQQSLKERFERCLDLYMAPRVLRKRLDIPDAEALLPKLPAPRELRPFPSTAAVVYAHPRATRVRCLGIDPSGAWLATGAEDGRVRLWDLALGRCAAVWDLWAGAPAADRTPVYALEWSPNRAHAIIAAVTTEKLVLIAPAQCSAGEGGATASPSFLFATAGYTPEGAANTAGKAPPAKWTRPSDGQRALGVASIVALPGTAKSVAWHSKGDYIATVAPDARSGAAVLIHQISRQRTQAPFSRAGKGSAVQAVLFHPLRPHLFVATQRLVRVYDLSAQSLLRTLQPGVRYISGLSVHPRGEHLLVASYDRRLVWFDLELSARPYKTLRYHARALRAVAFHASYPLFASVSDDGEAHVLHGSVYNDLATPPLLVPLKVLRGHRVEQGLGILDAKWHPSQPWLLTAGADGDARLWTP